MPAQNLAIDSNSLFAHNNVVYIQHHGECYLLRQTRSGKLILTK
ncbi:hemin uptake protein HemP [Nitrosomonas sp. Nm51]|nr:hemin uptake protein HemP [Nitrosomonas sp. Nm51]